MITPLRTSEQINEIATALALAQAKIEPAPKDSINPHFKSKYADLASVRSACKDPLAENNLSLLQAPSFIDGRVVMVTRLLHKSGQWFETELSLKPAQDTPQAIGSCITYARRYAAAALLGVVADEDDDGNAASAFKANNPRQIHSRNIMSENYNPDDQEKKAYLKKLMVEQGVKEAEKMKEISARLLGAPMAKLKVMIPDVISISANNEIPEG